MSRLIVASNRVADLDKAVQSGGLAVALEDALQRGRGLWFGWDGTTVDDDSSLGIKLQQHDGIRTATIPLTRRTVPCGRHFTTASISRTSSMPSSMAIAGSISGLRTPSPRS